jgi:cobalt-zinc-cadmium efflux system outer membrane protein
MFYRLNINGMKYISKTIFTLCLIIICGDVFSQISDTTKKGEKVLTLQEVIAALDKNPALLQFDEKIKSYDAYAKGARSLAPPKITGGFWMTPYNLDPNAGGALMVGAEQMIMNPGKRKAEQVYMEGISSVEQTMKAYDRQNMILEAKSMYYDWLVMKKKLRVLQESEVLLNLMIKSAEIGYTYNQNQLSRVYKAKSELYDLQNMQIMLRNDIRQMNISLNTMMNIDKGTVFDIDTNYIIANYDLLPIDTAAINQNRSDIKNIQESVRLTGLKKNMELSKRKPDFGVQYAHMNSLGSMPNQFNLMAMITIPIAPWAAKGYKANIQGLKFEEASLQKRREAIINETSGNIEKLKMAISNKKKQIDMYGKNFIPALEKNYNTSLIAFEHMNEDMFMTIDAWMALKMAKIEYLDLIGTLLKLQTSYERQIEKQ